MNVPPSRDPVGTGQSIVGVRLVGMSDITFCVSGIQPQVVGEWVLVSGMEGIDFGRVVIENRQLTGSPVDVTRRVMRRLRAGEIANLQESGHGLSVANDSREQFGSTGLPHDGRLLGEPTSQEDLRCRVAKRDLPQLGQSVATSKGPASVSAVDVRTRKVSCRLDADGVAIISTPENLTWT